MRSSTLSSPGVVRESASNPASSIRTTMKGFKIPRSAVRTGQKCRSVSPRPLRSWWKRSTSPLRSLDFRTSSKARNMGCLTLGIQRSSTSWGHTGVDPTLKDLHSLGRPRAVAWHRAILHVFQDVGSVSANVVEGPKIKRSFHRLPVMLSEERLDVGRKAQAVVVRRRIHLAQLSHIGPPAIPLMVVQVVFQSPCSSELYFTGRTDGLQTLTGEELLVATT